MKKILVLAGIVALSITSNVYANEAAAVKDCDKGGCPIERNFRGFYHAGPHHRMMKPPFDKEKFEKELNLTEAQKAQAEQIKQNTCEKIKPLKDKINEKKLEEKAIFEQKLTVKERMDKLAPIRKEIRESRKDIHKIRMESKKEFESILTDKQLKKLDKLKSDAKKQFKKEIKNMKGKRPGMKRPPVKPGCGCGCGCDRPLPIKPPVFEK